MIRSGRSLHATLRVADGSGVVLRQGKTALIATAAHVVRDGEIHVARKGAGIDQCPVIVRDEALDVAVLSRRPCWK